MARYFLKMDRCPSSTMMRPKCAVALAKRTGIGARTIYAFEQGESENFGLGNYLKLLDALGLSMSVDFLESGDQSGKEPASASLPIPEFGLADIWKLDGDAE